MAELKRMKKFRFQLMAKFIADTYRPCTVADVGGGKGLLSWLLQEKGFDSTVIDPAYQDLPWKYKDIFENKRVKMPQEAIVPHITDIFRKEHVEQFNLLVGLHAHGCNRWILEECLRLKKDFILVPCCVIDEPIEVQPNIDWVQSLIEYAQKLGHDVKTKRLNFKGQNLMLYTDTFFKKLETSSEKRE